MDFFTNLRQKLRDNTNYEEKLNEKKVLKEKVFRQRLQEAQRMIAEKEELPRRLRFDVIHHMKIYLAPNEMKQLNALKDEYKKTTYMVSAISLLNVVCTAAFIRGFWNYKWYSKAFIATFVFGTSHYCDKYSEQFLSSNFLKDKLSYDPTLPEPQLQVRKNNMTDKIDADKDLKQSK